MKFFYSIFSVKIVYKGLQRRSLKEFLLSLLVSPFGGLKVGGIFYSIFSVKMVYKRQRRRSLKEDADITFFHPFLKVGGDFFIRFFL